MATDWKPKTVRDQRALALRSNGRVPILSLSIFAVIPLTFLIVVLQMTRTAGPQWLAFNSDGPYQYLFNSLQLLETGHPTMYTHPGTPFEVFGALIISLTRPGSQKQKLVQDVIRDPEYFLKILHLTVLIGSAMTAWLAAWYVRSRLGSVWQGLLLQTPLLLFPTLTYYSIYFIPEVTLIGLCIMAAAIVLLLLHQAQQAKQTRLLLVLAGVISGVSIATKLTFFPMLLITMLCLKGWRSIAVFLLAFFSSAAVALVPIYSSLPEAYDWFLSLAIHSERYGGGPVGWPNMAEYMQHIHTLISADPLVFWIPLLSTCTGALIFLVRRLTDAVLNTRFLLRVILGIFVIQAISFLLIAKHPADYYMIALFFSTGLNLALLYQISIGKDRIHTCAAALGVVAIVAIGCFVPKSAIQPTAHWFIKLTELRKGQLRLYQQAVSETKNAVRVDYYRCPSPEFALFLGDGSTDHYFASFLFEQYPKALFYGLFDQMFWTFKEPYAPDVIAAKFNQVYFLGTLIGPPYDHFPPFDPKTFETVDSSGGCYLQKWTRKQSSFSLVVPRNTHDQAATPSNELTSLLSNPKTGRLSIP